MIAAGLGIAIGFERALRRKVASFRTFAMISSGSCLFTLLSVEAAHPGASTSGAIDATRIAAGIVTGIGFVGGGVIFKTSDRVEGITTGAMIWMASAIGMACGFGRTDMALWGFAVYLGIVLSAIVLHKLAAKLSNKDTERNGHKLG